MSRRRSKVSSKERRRKFRSLIARDGLVCALCGYEIDPDLPREHDFAYTMDHIKPACKGGTYRLDNLQLAHRYCNWRRGHREYGNS